MTNGNKKSNIRPLIYTIENYLQNHVHEQHIVRGNHSNTNAFRSQKEKQ